VIESLECPDLPDQEFEYPPQAMPDEYKREDSIEAYREYYAVGKAHLHHWKTRHAWKGRRIPSFIRKRIELSIQNN